MRETQQQWEADLFEMLKQRFYLLMVTIVFLTMWQMLYHRIKKNIPDGCSGCTDDTQ